MFVFSGVSVIASELRLNVGDEYDFDEDIYFTIYEIKEDSVDILIYLENEEELFTLFDYRETKILDMYVILLEINPEEDYVVLDLFDSEEMQRRINQDSNETTGQPDTGRDGSLINETNDQDGNVGENLTNETTGQPDEGRNGTVEEEFDCGTLPRTECDSEEKCAWSDRHNRCLGSGIENIQDRTRERIERIQNQTKVNPARQRVLNYINATECPEGCRCVGATIRCVLEDGTREMVVVAGASGNVIIQSKSVNATTSVEIIREDNETFMNISGQIRKMSVMPDEAFERIKERIKVSECRQDNCNIELDEKGKYHIKVQRRSRIFGIIPRNMNVNAEVDAESGEFKINKPWWSFIASEPEE